MGDKIDPIVVPPTVTEKGDRILNGGFLRRKEALVSPNKKFRLTFQADGNLVYKDDKEWILWAADKFDGIQAEMQPDGNFVLYTAMRKSAWATGSGSDKPENKTAAFIIQDDGDMVVKAGDVILWRSNTKISDRLEVNQYLRARGYLLSQNGNFRFQLQTSRRMELMSGGNLIWAQDGGGSDSDGWADLFLTDEENLIMLQGGKVIWATNTIRRQPGLNSSKAFLHLRDDGVLVLESEGLILWSNKKELIQLWGPVGLKPATEGSDKLNTGEYLLPGQSLVSPNGKFSAMLRKDRGTFDIVRNVSGVVIWSTGPADQGTVRLYRDWSGEVKIEGPKGSILYSWSSPGPGPGAQPPGDFKDPLTLHDDGVLSLFMWHTDIHLALLNGTLAQLTPGQAIAVDETLQSLKGEFLMGFTEFGTLYVQTKGTEGKTHYYMSDKPVQGCNLLVFEHEERRIRENKITPEDPRGDEVTTVYEGKITLKNVHGDEVISVSAAGGSANGDSFGIGDDGIIGMQNGNAGSGPRFCASISLKTGPEPKKP